MKRIHSVVWKEGKWYVAKALEVEVASQGLTEKEALNNLKEALELYFEDQSKLQKKNLAKTYTAIVPNHKEVAQGTFSSILNQAGMTKLEFEKFIK